MKAPKASTEAQKMDFLAGHEQEIRKCEAGQQMALRLRLAREMKAAGLYSQKTYLVDIAGGIRNRVQRWGWAEE